MSVCTFIAADVALDEIKNPHYKLLSINEALAMGLEVSEVLLYSGVDRDEPDVILCSDAEVVVNVDKGTVFDGDAEDNFALYTLKDPQAYCDKPYAVYLEWNYYTEERAKRIIAYIKDVLKKTDCVEIWNVWLDYDTPVVKTVTISIEELQPQDIKEIYDCDPWDNKSIISTYGPDTPICYCFRIVS
jgi:hypothetical protein